MIKPILIYLSIRNTIKYIESENYKYQNNCRLTTDEADELMDIINANRNNIDSLVKELNKFMRGSKKL